MSPGPGWGEGSPQPGQAPSGGGVAGRCMKGEPCRVALSPGSGWYLTLLVSGTAFLPFFGILGPQDFCTSCSLSLEHTFPPRVAPRPPHLPSVFAPLSPPPWRPSPTDRRVETGPGFSPTLPVPSSIWIMVARDLCCLVSRFSPSPLHTVGTESIISGPKEGL